MNLSKGTHESAPHRTSAPFESHEDDGRTRPDQRGQRRRWQPPHLLRLVLAVSRLGPALEGGEPPGVRSTGSQVPVPRHGR